MTSKNYIITQFLALVWIYFLCLPAILGAQNTADHYESEFSLISITANSGQNNFIVAQNNRNGEIEKGSDSTPDEESGQASESEKQPRKQKREPDPIESFEPTEKVKADQAVDFPYDI
jgi:hypothetical protein